MGKWVIQRYDEVIFFVGFYKAMQKGDDFVDLVRRDVLKKRTLQNGGFVGFG